MQCDAIDCQKNALKICGECRQTRYHSLQCQRQDWKNHKALCRLRTIFSTLPLGLVFSFLKASEQVLFAQCLTDLKLLTPSQVHFSWQEGLNLYTQNESLPDLSVDRVRQLLQKKAQIYKELRYQADYHSDKSRQYWRKTVLQAGWKQRLPLTQCSCLSIKNILRSGFSFISIHGASPTGTTALYY